MSGVLPNDLTQRSNPVNEKLYKLEIGFRGPLPRVAALLDAAASLFGGGGADAARTS